MYTKKLSFKDTSNLCVSVSSGGRDVARSSNPLLTLGVTQFYVTEVYFPLFINMFRYFEGSK